MAMHEPDCDSAYKRGEKIAEVLIQRLVAEHKLYKGHTSRQKTDWEKAEKTAIDAIANLFVEDVCNSF